MIPVYFADIRTWVAEYAHIVVSSSISEKIYSEQKGYISGSLLFIDGSQLDFTEVKSVSKAGKEKYSYHFMDSGKNLVFRYDNAPHFREIETFPHHLHLPDDTVASTEPTLNEVLRVIEGVVLQKP